MPGSGLGPGEGTWECHVCHDVRPDDKISVHKEQRDIVEVNVRYCNDRPECRQGAPAVADRWLGREPDRTRKPVERGPHGGRH